MFPTIARSAIFVSAAASLFSFVLCGAGQAESVRSQCSAKYQAAKSAGTLNGQSWNQFYSQCAAEAKAGDTQPAAAPTAAPAAPAPSVAPAAPAAPRSSRASTPVTPPPAAEPAETGNAVFPTAISPQYSTLSPGKARFKTCDDQYRANKATNGNGGLKWIQKGGGYYSECNKKLKS